MGEPIYEPIEVVASDAEGFEEYGFAVAISENTAVVGAPMDDEAGFRSGAVYVYDIATGQQLHKLIGSDTVKRDQFGETIAMSGDTFIVGVRFDAATGDAGAAYVFDATSGEQLHKLTASDGAFGDRFGAAVDMCGSLAIIGAWGNDDNGSQTGSAYVFDITTGQQLFNLTASDALELDFFGVSVAISGTTAIVGAPGTDAPFNSGSAYVFDLTTGEEKFKLLASDRSVSASFGNAVAIDGTTAIVGAADVESAYIFDTTTGDELLKLDEPEGTNYNRWGFSVAICGDTAVIGAGGSNGSTATVHDVTTGRQFFRFPDACNRGADPRIDVDFPMKNFVGVSGTKMIHGMRYCDGDGLDSGAAFIYTDVMPCTGNWNGDGSLNFFDIPAYLADFNAAIPAADLAEPFGTLNFFDVAEYIAAFNAGCP